MSEYTGLSEIISGGQTGADQGGLLAARAAGLLTGGTAPAKFMTANGPNPLLRAFGLVAKGNLQSRTMANIIDSDATVVLSADMASPGTVLTLRYCRERRKPCLAIDTSIAMTTFGDTGGVLTATTDDWCEILNDFIRLHSVRTLNVAGNRERFNDLRTTWVTEIFLRRTFQLLDLDNLLIRQADL